MKMLITKISVCVVAAILMLPFAAHAGMGGGGGGGGGDLTAVRVSGEVLVPPDDAVWNNASATSIDLMFVDWVVDGKCRSSGNASVTVKAIHNGTDIAFLLSWDDADNDTVINGVGNFTDATAIMYNANRLCDMGSPDNPTNIWYWRAVDDTVQNLLSGGRGTITHTDGDDNISVISGWDGSQWQVVLSRPLAATDLDDQVDLVPGNSYPVAFATWDGVNRERNGRKMRSGKKTLNIDP